LLSWKEHPDVVRATKTIRLIDEQHTRDSVDRAERIGKLLRAVHGQLAHGEWMRWLETALPIELSTAQRYIAVALFAETEPAEWKHVKSLSLRKIYRLIRAPKSIRDGLYGRAHRIPGTDLRLSLTEMSLPQLELVLRELGGTRSKDEPLADMLRSTHRAIAGLSRQMGTLLEQSAKLDRKAITKLRTEVAHVLDQVDEALEL
jgi:hypothetical protein